jgi:short-subunit dehydrogenase
VKLDGKTALLTGATGGLGRTIAQRLAERGAAVTLSSRRAQDLTDLAGVLPGEGHRAIVADLALDGAADRLVAEAGRVDVLVANAGLPGTGTVEGFSEQELTRALRVNLEAPMRMARALLPALLERGEGHLVFVASLAGKSPAPRSAVYNATKFGLRGFALGLRCDLAGTGVGASVVSPGFVREAGLFADSGAAPPPGLGTTTPKKVAAAVVRAIEQDRHEVGVAPVRQRALAHLALANPGFAVRVNSGRTARRSAESLANGQTDKR